MQGKAISNTITRLRRALPAFMLLLAVAKPKPASGQVTGDPRDTTHAETQNPFFTTKDFVLAATFAGGTVLMLPFDRRLAQELTEPDAQANTLLRHTTTNVELITSPGAYIIGGGLYLVGRLGHFDRVADLGWHGTEAILFAEGTTYFLKGVVGRGRPFLSNGGDPGNFKIGKGFSSGDWSSFPSGHTSTAFAAAAAVTNETTRWWPRSTWVVGPLMYGGATFVGLSRMYHSRHWASDVVLGAAIGMFSGRKIVQYAHGHPGNRLDRILLRTSFVPDGHGGGLLAFSLPVP